MISFACIIAAAAVSVEGSQSAFEIAAEADVNINWFGPFLSGGGYSSEALAFITALNVTSAAAAEDSREFKPIQIEVGGGVHLTTTVTATHHGDSVNRDFFDGLPQAARDLLRSLGTNQRPPSKEEEEEDGPLRLTVDICHSEPGAWSVPRPNYNTAPCPRWHKDRASSRERSEKFPGGRPGYHYHTVGRTMFETDRLPDGWAQRLNEMDEVWVPGEFHRRVFAEGGVDTGKLFVLHEPVDTAFFDPSLVTSSFSFFGGGGEETVVAPPQTGGETFVFLSIFKWEERKGWRTLLAAYFSEFSRTNDADVVLVLLTNPYHGTSDFQGEVERFAASCGIPVDDLPRVHVMEPGLPQNELPSLYKSADCFVLPSRGEGWGRPHVEAMAMALPVIATNWSGTTEYMTAENSFPLRIDGLVPVEEGAFRGHLWADPSVAHLKELMRFVKENPDDARRRGKRARTDMTARFSPERLADDVLTHLRRISDKKWRERAAAAAAAAEKEEEASSTKNEL